MNPLFECSVGLLRSRKCDASEDEIHGEGERGQCDEYDACCELTNVGKSAAAAFFFGLLVHFDEHLVPGVSHVLKHGFSFLGFIPL